MLPMDGVKILTIFAVFIQTSSYILAQNGPIVNTTNGVIQGTVVSFQNTQVNAFFGIPYAKPPVGDLRFKRPVPKEPWTGIYNATKLSNPCYQPGRQFSEDCLYLNIWTKGGSKALKPVMVYIHGGGFTGGSGGDTEGRILAAMHDVVVVAMNYRLGAFGFLNAYTEDAPGNMGILDQNLALRWIQANINNFGGNASEITLFGCSAGSWSVNIHTLTPISRGMFQRAILMSGSVVHPVIAEPPELSLKKSNSLSVKLGCADDANTIINHPEKVVGCLRTKSANDIVRISGSWPNSFYPSYNTEVLPFSPELMAKMGRFNPVDLMVGTMSGEGVFVANYLPKDIVNSDLTNITLKNLTTAVKHAIQISNMYPEGSLDAINYYLDRANDKQDVRLSGRDFIGDNLFICPSVYFAEIFSERGNKVYQYQFSHHTKWMNTPEWTGASHGGDQIYIFGLVLNTNVSSNKEKNLSIDFMNMWTSFAKTGKLQLKNGTEWPAFTRSNPVYVDLDINQFKVQNGLRADACNFWRSYILKN